MNRRYRLHENTADSRQLLKRANDLTVEYNKTIDYLKDLRTYFDDMTDLIEDIVYGDKNVSTAQVSKSLDNMSWLLTEIDARIEYAEDQIRSEFRKLHI